MDWREGATQPAGGGPGMVHDVSGAVRAGRCGYVCPEASWMTLSYLRAWRVLDTWQVLLPAACLPAPPCSRHASPFFEPTFLLTSIPPGLGHLSSGTYIPKHCRAVAQPGAPGASC